MEQTKATENLSQWFNLDEQTPWEPGVYEVDEDSSGKWFSYWDGKKFGYLVMDVNEAIEEFSLHTDFVVEKWRGLDSDPSAKPKARGNRRVTRYVVISASVVDSWKEPLAVFSSLKNVRLYSEACDIPVRVKKIRFRTPEAD